MNKFKGFVNTLPVILILIALVFPAFGSSDGEKSFNEVGKSLKENQEQKKIIKKKFEDLDAESKGKAESLGYKKGDLVAMCEETNGKLTILPPDRESLSPVELKKKLMNLISQKIAKNVTDNDIDIQFNLALDLTGNFTIKTKFENLYETVKEEAKNNGYEEEDIVKVIVDSPSLEYRVEKISSKMNWPTKVLEVIPSKEEGGVPSLKCFSNFNDLSHKLQERARTKGYEPGDSVIYIFHKAEGLFEVLMKPLHIGLSCKWNELSRKEKKKAKSLGYSPGDTVWKSTDSNGRFNFPKKILIGLEEVDGNTVILIGKTGIFTLVPSNEIGEGPLIKITHVFQRGILRTLTKFSYLNDSDRTNAIAEGYKKGDEVLYYYFLKSKQKKIQPPPKK